MENDLRKWMRLIDDASSDLSSPILINEAQIPNVASDIYGLNLSFGELRKRAKLRLLRIRGTKKIYHNKSKNIDIMLSNNSIGSSVSHATNADILKLMSRIDYILEDSRFLYEEKPKDDTEPSLISVLRFAAILNLDGQPKKVVAIVKKQTSGNYIYYSLHDLV